MITGALGNEWSVTYSVEHLCALKGSTVFMNGSYTHPTGLTVTETYWVLRPNQSKDPSDLRNDPGFSGRVEYLGDKQKHFSFRLSDVNETDNLIYYFRIKTNKENERWIQIPGVRLNVTGQSKDPADLRNEPGFSGRVEYLGDKQKHSSLRLSHVKKTDENKYYFRIRTNEEKENQTGEPGVRLTVTDLQLIAPAEVTEGQSAVLTCKTTCSLTDPTFIWYKNSRDLTTKTIMDNEVHLQPVSSEDAGSYSCAVRGYEHLPSPAQTLRVRYPPKNISVSISPSGEIVEGISVTLTCNIDANPPVENYTWFKETTFLGKENTYTISNISSEDSGEYKCRCSNEVGTKYSSGVTLNVLYPPKNISVFISPSGEIVEGSLVTLTCTSDANPHMNIYTWFKEKTFLRKENTYTISNISSEDSGEYKCKCSNGVGIKYSSVVTLNVLYPPKNVSVSISPSGEILEDSSVILTCSSDANPPVEIYTWFKVNESSAVGSGQSYRALQSGQYYCQAQNKHGSDRSAAVSVTFNVHSRFQSRGVYAGVGVVVFLCICLIAAFLFIRKYKKGGSTLHQNLKQNEVLYTSIVHQTARYTESSTMKSSASKNNESQYASVTFIHIGADL
ncbi:B-cell receptor CD22-like, partial [Clarias magur]